MDPNVKDVILAVIGLFIAALQVWNTSLLQSVHAQSNSNMVRTADSFQATNQKIDDLQNGKH